MADFLARVTWENIRRYREELREGVAGEDSRRLPLTDQYGSDQRALNKLKFGDGLWLFTAPVFGKSTRRRTLPPSVLGRISITHQWNRGTDRMQPAIGAPSGTVAERNTHMIGPSEGYRYWRCGIPGEALPIHNAFSLFKSLTFKGRVKQVSDTCKRCNPSDVPKQGPFGHLMQHFESIRTLTNDSVKSLNKLYDHVAARRTIFMSHRHHEAGSLVSEVAEHLQDHALCWWDVQALPQSRRYSDRLLQEMLNDGIRQAGSFVAFLTPDYAATRWTDDEWKEAQALCANLPRGPKIVPVLLGGELREGMEEQQPISVGEDAKEIAAAIRDRFESLD
jgi:hypothetical protein